MQLAQTKQLGTFYPTFTRKLAAKFLGLAPAQVTNDCKILGIEKHPSGMAPEEVFFLWGYRLLLVHLYPTSTRSQVAKKIKTAPKTSLKELQKAGYTFEMFCQQLQIFLESNHETNTPLNLNRPERQALKDYRAKKEIQKIKTNRLYLSRREAARLLGCSVGAVVNMLKALGLRERSLITESVFLNLVELRAKTKIWDDSFKKQSKVVMKLKRRAIKRGSPSLLNNNFIYRPKYAQITNWRYANSPENRELNKKLEVLGVKQKAKAAFYSVVKERLQIEPIDFNFSV
jgi:hypothetical protein